MHDLKWVCFIKRIIKCVPIQPITQRSETQDSTSSLFIILTFLSISVFSLIRAMKSRKQIIIVLCLGMIEVPFTSKDQEMNQFKVWVIVGHLTNEYTKIEIWIMPDAISYGCSPAYTMLSGQVCKCSMQLGSVL